MKIETEILAQMRFNSDSITKINHRLKLLNNIINLEKNIDELNFSNAQLVEKILLKENRIFEDIQDLDLQKGEITFKEKENAEPTRPDNQVTAD